MNVIVRLLLLACVACYFPAAQAQQAEVGTGILCDTSDQLEQLVAYANESRDFAASMQRVNVDAKSAVACAMASVAFIRGDVVKTVRTPDGMRDIVRIVVIGSASPAGVRPVAPAEQFTLFATKGKEI